MNFSYLSGLVCMILSCAGGIMAYEAKASEPVDQDAYQPFKLVAGDLAIQIAPARAFTINSIWYRDVHIGLGNGQYGFVFSSNDHHWVGTGHLEGGREEVLTVQLTIDGQERDIPVAGGEIEVESASIVKTARLKGLLLTSRIDLHPDRLEQSHNVSFASETHIRVAYAFMHCWTPKTKQWLARYTDGELAEGVFTDEGWKLRASNVLWTASYEPESETVILTTFPPDLRPGEGIRHTYWDLPRYHKQYYQPFRDRMFGPGDTFEFHMTVRLFHAPTDEWGEITKRIADGK